MAIKMRRVVTGHDANGRARVMFDGVSDNVISKRAGHSSCVMWTTDTSPADNTGDEDAALAEVGTCMPGGTVFRIIEYAPGVAGRMHRTDSIDYIVVLSGEIAMELDDGEEVTLQAGDCLIQRGTIHNWVNRGSESCTIAVVLVDAKPVEAGGRTLNAVG